MSDNKQHIALVTGASRGMGRHFVAALVERGARVACLARASAELDSLVDEFGEAADFHISSLFALGFMLFIITFVVLAAAKIMINRAEKAKGF